MTVHLIIKVGNAIKCTVTVILSEEKKTDLKRASKGRVKFLPRRTYENYLLNSDALSALLTRRGVALSREKIEQWITENGGKEEYYKDRKWDKNVSDVIWLKEVNAANILERLFSDLTKAKLEYKKIEYGIELTSWLLEHDTNSIRELIDYVVELVRPARA